ncbi:MAG: dienelactone hydrolase family protein [Opitutales bacterium]|nr:dienelactone hydrolase family protein [Opitutales bacterium]
MKTFVSPVPEPVKGFGFPPWPPRPWVPDYRVEELGAWEESEPDTRSEEARLLFSDWMGREVSLFVRRSFPLCGANGAAVLHIVGGAQTIHPGDLAVWTREGYAAASFDWQIAEVGGRLPERTSCFPAEVVPQFAATPSLGAAILPVALQAAAVCLHWLARCPGVDEGRLGVTGISWGGYLSWLLAAYDSRVRALVPVFGCGGLFAEGRSVAAHDPAVRAYWEKFWEPAALGRHLNCPVCFLNGTNDFFGDPLVAERLLASVRTPVARSYGPNIDHALTEGQTALATAWMRQYLSDAASRAPSSSPDIGLDEGRGAPVSWWAGAEGASMHRCWLPGPPPSDRPAYVVTNREMADGAILSSPIRLVETVEAPAAGMGEAGPSFVSGVTSVAGVPFGLGWRWELGSTRHFENDAHAIPPASADHPWMVTPARPLSDEAVAVILHLNPRGVRGAASADSFALGWSASPESGQVFVEIFGRTPGMEPFVASFPWLDGWVLLKLGDVPGLPADFTWADVGRLQIKARQGRQPFGVGPLRCL